MSRRRNFGMQAILFYVVFVLTFGCANIQTVKAEGVYTKTEQAVLEKYGLSNMEYQIFDGKNYYPCEPGVTYNGNPFRIVTKKLPQGISYRCVGDAQVNAGEYIVQVLYFTDSDKHNPIAVDEVRLKINKVSEAEVKQLLSAVEFNDSYKKYDGLYHKLSVTNLPEGWRVDRYEGYSESNGFKEVGSWPITAYLTCDDIANYEPIEPLRATLNIVGDKDPNKLNYDESGIKFENAYFTYDKKEHSIFVSGIPEGVTVTYTGNNRTKTGTVTAHFKGDYEKYNPILDREATITITETNSDSSSSSGSRSFGSSNGGSSNTTTPPKPEKPSEHIWSAWASINDLQCERECSHCGIKETSEHQDIASKVEFEAKDGNTHTVKTAYSCTKCGRTYEDVQQKNCEYDGSWNYIGNNTDEMYCKQCNYSQTRTHQHDPMPNDLVYVFKESNNDGTHKLEASYNCICGEVITVDNDENCEYGNITYRQTGVNDIHIEEKECKVCNYINQVEGTCVPTGELKCIKKYAQIYDYYDCGLCGDWCQRVYHTVHRFEDWEYRDEDTHIRYCPCGDESLGGRETENHGYVYDKNNFTGKLVCDKCGSTKDVVEHDHGYNTEDEMGLMDIISSPAYAEILSDSQIANPNPSPNDYCSRYEFKCKTCGVKYYIHYAHKFVDGVCTRKGYCGGIVQANLIFDIAIEFEKETKTNVAVEVKIEAIFDNKEEEEEEDTDTQDVEPKEEAIEESKPEEENPEEANQESQPEEEEPEKEETEETETEEREPLEEESQEEEELEEKETIVESEVQ